MPDPSLYLKALIAAAGSSAVIVLVFRLILRKTVCSVAPVAPVLAFCAGLLAGYRVLEFEWSWPPANALNRFLMMVLPATVILELLVGLAETVCFGAKVSNKTRFDESPMPEPSPAQSAGRVLRIPVTALRLSLFFFLGPILLHGSVYLQDGGRGNPEAWTPLISVMMLCGSVGLLTLTVILLNRLSQRSAAVSVPLSLALAILSAGIATMLAGYIKGGAASIPLAAALIGTSVASPLLVSFVRSSRGDVLHGTIVIGVVGLFSLLCIGRFFGQVSGLSAIVIYLSPLLCWISEIPQWRLKAVWQVSSVRLIAVCIPLATVLIVAKSNFDQKMAPLLSTFGSPSSFTAQPQAPALVCTKPAPAAGR